MLNKHSIEVEVGDTVKIQGKWGRVVMMSQLDGKTQAMLSGWNSFKTSTFNIDMIKEKK